MVSQVVRKPDVLPEGETREDECVNHRLCLTRLWYACYPGLEFKDLAITYEWSSQSVTSCLDC